MRTLKSIVLTILAALGVASLGLFAFCLIFGYSVVLFSTGSMNPTIPKGSLALVKTIPAAEIRLGDIITVNRDDGLQPITHRVVEIRAGATASERVIRMKGDANLIPDFDEYTVTQVRRNVYSLRGGAELFLAIFDNPLLTALAFTGFGGLVIWTLWPSRERRPRGEETPREQETPPVSAPHDSHPPHNHRR